ncbi:MAG TPA: hypothetical protein DCE00_05065 [Firmicutes bacterium]|jgi:hypothetical protein|nr:hypothetical protein [Bacillota bacterium]
MRGRILLIILSILLVLSGCAAVTISEEAIAAKITACCQQLSPGGSTISLLTTLPYRGKLLVLAAEQTSAEAVLLDLFLLDNDGAAALASAALTPKIKLHRLVEGGETLIYGPLPAEQRTVTQGVNSLAAKEESSDYAEHDMVQLDRDFNLIKGKAAITLSSWKIIEQELPLAKGFILILKQRKVAEAINLYDEEGTLLAQYTKLSTGTVKDTEFVPWDKLPLPCKLQPEQIAEIWLAASLTPAAEERVSLAEEELYTPLIKAINSCYPQLVRTAAEPTAAKLVVNIELTDGKAVVICQHSSYITVSFQNAAAALTYAVDSPELTDLFAAYRKLL